ncbi:MAG: hypothetical protein N2689_16240 [Verrucomicrobiae bacterium]|nr:hypothetical protein [Verrucomicrobiae bacterium]
MGSIGHFTFAPLRSIQKWREGAANAREVHSAFYYVWCALGTPFLLVACIGYVFCLLLFPSMLLGLGLAIAQKQPGIGWCIYAACALLFWTMLYLIQLKGAVRQLRARVIDVEAWTVVLMMSLSYVVAAWYVSYEIGK